MSEKIRIAIRHAGKFIGVDPTPVTSLPAVGRRGKATPVTGDDQFPVYQDRDQPGAWETLEATSHGDAKNPFYDLLAMSSQRQLSWTDENRFESRAAGVLGAWESRFRIAEQPDGRCLGWRDDRIDHVFEVIKL